MPATSGPTLSMSGLRRARSRARSSQDSLIKALVACSGNLPCTRVSQFGELRSSPCHQLRYCSRRARIEGEYALWQRIQNYRTEKLANSGRYSRQEIFRWYRGFESLPLRHRVSIRALRASTATKSARVRAISNIMWHQRMAPPGVLGRFSEIYLRCEMSRCQDDERQLQPKSGIDRSSARATRFPAAEFRERRNAVVGSLTPPTWETRSAGGRLRGYWLSSCC